MRRISRVIPRRRRASLIARLMLRASWSIRASQRAFPKSGPSPKNVPNPLTCRPAPLARNIPRHVFCNWPCRDGRPRPSKHQIFFGDQKWNLDDYICAGCLSPLFVLCLLGKGLRRLVAESVYETASIFDAEPQKYCVQMGFDCAFAHLELARNCFIWVPSAHKRYDLSLAVGQITGALNNSFPRRLRPTETGRASEHNPFHPCPRNCL